MTSRRLAEPLERREPTIYFVNSMSDLFHGKASFSYIERVFDVRSIALKAANRSRFRPSRC